MTKKKANPYKKLKIGEYRSNVLPESLDDRKKLSGEMEVRIHMNKNRWVQSKRDK